LSESDPLQPVRVHELFEPQLYSIAQTAVMSNNLLGCLSVSRNYQSCCEDTTSAL